MASRAWFLCAKQGAARNSGAAYLGEAVCRAEGGAPRARSFSTSTGPPVGLVSGRGEIGRGGARVQAARRGAAWGRQLRSDVASFAAPQHRQVERSHVAAGAHRRDGLRLCTEVWAGRRGRRRRVRGLGRGAGGGLGEPALVQEVEQAVAAGAALLHRCAALWGHGTGGFYAGGPAFRRWRLVACATTLSRGVPDRAPGACGLGGQNPGETPGRSAARDVQGAIEV